ncbi:MAG: chalcone isomerase family protein [Thermodesulfobacteriota bacterium]
MMMKKACIIFVLLLILAPAAGAAVVSGVTLPDTITVEGQQLVLNGAGMREKKFLVVPVDVYVAGLYLKSKTSAAQAIIDADETMMLKIQIVSSHLTAEKFKNATLEGFQESTGGNTGPIQKEIDLFMKAFAEEIKQGDVFDIQYVKDKGVLVYKNGKTTPEVLVPGLNVKKALFGIWLGKRTESYLQVLATKLLGK